MRLGPFGSLLNSPDSSADCLAGPQSSTIDDNIKVSSARVIAT